MKKISLIVPKVYLRNKAFDLSDPDLNQDNRIHHTALLKQELFKKGFDLSTHDINRPEDSSLVIYSEIPENEVSEKALLILLEAPATVERNWNIDKHKKFIKVFTYNDDLLSLNSLIEKKYIKIKWPAVLSVPEFVPFSEREKGFVLVCANKYSHHPQELYSERRKIIRFFENRMKNLGMLNFSGSNPLGSLGGDQISTRSPTLISGYLSASRIAPGSPGMSGSLVNNISNRKCDGLFTSGSWTLETRARMRRVFDNPVTQSIVRLHTTGAQSDGKANNFLIYNLVATNNFNAIGSKGKVTLFGRHSSSQSSKILTMSVDANIFDGNTWSLSFGRFRNDLSGAIKYASSRLLSIASMSDNGATSASIKSA